jgi:hypothetical protein
MHIGPLKKVSLLVPDYRQHFPLYFRHSALAPDFRHSHCLPPSRIVVILPCLSLRRTTLTECQTDVNFFFSRIHSPGQLSPGPDYSPLPLTLCPPNSLILSTFTCARLDHSPGPYLANSPALTLSDPSTAPQKTVSIYYYHKKKFTSVPAA